jgi:hypothetical protein
MVAIGDDIHEVRAFGQSGYRHRYSQPPVGPHLRVLREGHPHAVGERWRIHKQHIDGRQYGKVAASHCERVGTGLGTRAERDRRRGCDCELRADRHPEGAAAAETNSDVGNSVQLGTA